MKRRTQRRKLFKLSHLGPEPGVGVVVSWPEPTLPQLQQLQAQLNEHTVKPLPPPLLSQLRTLISWAAWSLNLKWTPERIYHQRYYAVCAGREEAVRKGLKRGVMKYAYRYAAEALRGHPAECEPDMMRKSFEAVRDATYE